MAHSVAHVAAALPDAFRPGIEVQLAIQLDVGPPDPNPFAVNSRKIRLAAVPRPVPAIERVIPHVQLGNGISVDCRDEVDRRNLPAVRPLHGMGHVHHILIRPDSVIRRNRIGWDCSLRGLNSVAGMGRATNGPLLLGPLESIEPEGRPVLPGIAAGIYLLLEPQKAEMPGLM